MSYEITPYEDKPWSEDADIAAYNSMLELRAEYEFASAEASAMEIIHGVDTQQFSDVIDDGVSVWTEIERLRTPAEARAMLAVFSRGTEASRSIAALKAPGFIFKGLVSYNEGMAYINAASADVNPDVVDAAHAAIQTNSHRLMDAARKSGDELAPRRLQRLASI